MVFLYLASALRGVRRQRHDDHVIEEICLFFSYVVIVALFIMFPSEIRNDGVYRQCLLVHYLFY